MFVLVVSIIVGVSLFHPATMPIYHLTDGNKNIVFIGMIHIAKPSYYNTIYSLLVKYKTTSQYVYLYEGANRDNPEKTKSDEEKLYFSTVIAEKLNLTYPGGLHEIYKKIALLTGLQMQNNIPYINIPGINVNADMDGDLILKKIEQLALPNNKLNGINLIEAFALISKINKHVLRVFFRILVKITKVYKDDINENSIKSILVNDRNKILIEKINQYDNVIITYGLGHFKGVFEILKTNNPNWKIVKTETISAI